MDSTSARKRQITLDRTGRNNRQSLDLYDAALQRNGDGVRAIVGGKFCENDLHMSLHGLF